MEFKSVFAHREHKTYKNTFLKKAYTQIFYDKGEWGRGSFLDNVKPFAKEHFNVDVTGYNKDNAMTFFAPMIETEYIFNCDHASVNIGRNGYRSFDTTMKEHVCTLQSFVSDVLKNDVIKSMILGKVNTWTIETKERISDISDLVRFIVREKYADRIKKDGDDVVEGTIRIKSPLETNGADLFMEFGFDYSECPKLLLSLELQARYSPCARIKIGDMLNIAEGMNSAVYDAYFGIVTDNVIDVMDGKVKL